MIVNHFTYSSGVWVEGVEADGVEGVVLVHIFDPVGVSSCSPSSSARPSYQVHLFKEM